MTTFNSKAEEVKDLSYEEQVLVILLEIMDRLVMGNETLARVNYVVHDLFNGLPWHELTSDSVRTVANDVSRYGISRLPGYRQLAEATERPDGTES